MRDRIFRSRVSNFATALACLAYLAVAASVPVHAKQPQTTINPVAPGKWQTYANERYAFTLSYPPDGRVETLRDGRHQHLRILNYARTSENLLPLNPGEYDVEVFIYDHRLGHTLQIGCGKLLWEPRSVKLGKVKGVRGTIEQAEDGSTPFAVCVESGRLEILVTVSGPDPLGSLANRILNSVRFGN